MVRWLGIETSNQPINIYPISNDPIISHLKKQLFMELLHNSINEVKNHSLIEVL